MFFLTTYFVFQEFYICKNEFSISRNYKPKTSLLDAILGKEVSGMTSFGKVIVIMGLLFFFLGKFILFILLLISTFYFLVRKNALKGNFPNEKIQDFWLTEEEKTHLSNYLINETKRSI
jgi:hypothetical protein